MLENRVCDVWVCEDGEDAHAAAAVGTSGNIDVEHSLEKAGPIESSRQQGGREVGSRKRLGRRIGRDWAGVGGRVGGGRRRRVEAGRLRRVRVCVGVRRVRRIRLRRHNAGEASGQAAAGLVGNAWDDGEAKGAPGREATVVAEEMLAGWRDDSRKAGKKILGAEEDLGATGSIRAAKAVRARARDLG